MGDRDNCQKYLREQGKPYPRTCAVCGLFGGCAFDKSVTAPKAVPLLQDYQAKTIAEVYKLPFMRAEVEAIASGEAVVIPRITREALREALNSVGTCTFSETQFIAALKRLGVKIGE